METLSRLLCLPSFLRLVTEHLQVEQRQIILTIASTQKSVPCPECHFPSPKIHSHYERTVADISLAEYRVIWKLWVRKFFCRNRACHKRIFSERLLEIVAPW
ncbi:MAG: transposase family protein, partial [Microcystaceae cyanobacterium]